jgi:predicted nucleic acid-binding protein
MSVIVVDASVVVKWYLPEVHGEAALRLLDSPDEFIAPDHLFAETTNAIWKAVRRRELSAAEGLDIIARLDDEVEIDLVSCRTLTADALEIAVTFGRSVYDAMYIALAINRNTRLITADSRLYNALAKIPKLAPHIQFIRDY